MFKVQVLGFRVTEEGGLTSQGASNESVDAEQIPVLGQALGELAVCVERIKVYRLHGFQRVEERLCRTSCSMSTHWCTKIVNLTYR